MKKFFSFIIKQSVAVVLITVFVLGFGVFATSKMAINLLPDINVPIVCVQNIYVGASASSVETDVTAVVEEGLSSIGGLTDIQSYSYDNLSAVALMLDYGTDTDGVKSEIQQKLANMSLPSGVQTSVYDLDLNASALAVLSLTSDKGLENAYTAAEELASKLAAIDGVANVQIKGAPAHNLVLKPFGGLELTVPLFVQAFSYGALNLPLGSITEDGDGVQIRNDTTITSRNDILNMPVTLPESLVNLLKIVKENIAEGLADNGYDISTPAGAETVASNPLVVAYITVQLGNNELSKDLKISADLVRFIIRTDFDKVDTDSALTVKAGDIANLEEENAFSSYVYFGNGGAQLVSGTVIEVSKSNGANAAAVVDGVKSVYAQFLKDSGEEYGAKITLLDDQSEFISDSISNVLVSMLIGGVLAIAVIFLFLRKVKTSLIIAVTMPLSVLAALICLYIMGITLNMVSLGGLAVGIGMLVDNSIVVIESISKHRDKGKSAFEAAVDGTVEVGGALFGSTLTTVCVFIPIIFSGGLTGEIFTDLSFAVIYSLTFSLIIALSVIPAFYAMFTAGKRMLKGSALAGSPASPAAGGGAAVQTSEVAPEPAPEKPAQKAGIMQSITTAYGNLLPKVLGKKLVVILTAVAIFALSIGMLFLTGTEFLPSIDKGQIEVNMTFEDGVSLTEKEKEVKDFSDVLLKNVENIDYISVNVGKNGLLAFNDTGIITVQLTTDRGTDKIVDYIRSLGEDERYRPKLARVSVKQIDGVVASLFSGSSDMSVTITGESIEELTEISEEICDKLQDSGFYAYSSAQAKVDEYKLNFDRLKMEQLGIDYQTLVLTLRIGIASYTACTVTIDSQSYNLNVQFDKNSVKSITELQSLVVSGSSDGTPESTSLIKLGDICEIKKVSADACICRYNGKRMVSVSATLPGADTGSASKKMQKIAEEVLAEHEGYSFASSGVTSYLNDAFAGLAVALVISFFLLYAVMAIQFGSGLKPLIVMASIPFSFTGGFVALVITGTSLNVVSFIGLIMLMGVVVNNAIVMLEKIRQLADEGMKHVDAVTEACKERLRPILMTTLTTILALIPMAIGVGSGAELMQPLGIVVIGGLLLSTLVTLVLVPAVYCAVHKLKPAK